MLPPRVALNMVYAWYVRDLDQKQRKEFDGQLYGWNAENETANHALFHGGGEG